MLSYAEMKRILADLEPTLLGKKIQKVKMLKHFGLAFECYGFDPASKSTEKRWLLISADPKVGRLHGLQSPPDPEESVTHPFAAQLKKQAVGGVLAKIALLDGDRVAEFHIEGKLGYRVIVAELLGGAANVFLLDQDRHILGALRAITPSRGFSQGEAWQPPEASPMPEAAWRDRFEGVNTNDLQATVEQHFNDQQASGDAQGLRAALSRALKQEREFIERKMQKIDDDLASQSRYNEYRRYGELIKAYLPTLEVSGDELEVVDYDEEGIERPVIIPIDRSLSLTQNMDHYFKLYRKGAKGSQKLGTHLNVLMAARNDIRSMQQEVESMADETLESYAERPSVKRILSKHASHLLEEEEREQLSARQLNSTRMIPRPQAEPKRNTEPHLRPRAIRTIDGWEVLVGKGAAGNDHLTMQIANGNDTFLHVDGVPGSHVIVRAQAGKVPPLETMLDAAQLAMYFSKMREAGKASVSYTQKKHVKKPKGAKPGLVVLNQHKKLSVRRDQSRLDRLLGRELGS